MSVLALSGRAFAEIRPLEHLRPICIESLNDLARVILAPSSDGLKSLRTIKSEPSQSLQEALVAFWNANAEIQQRTYEIAVQNEMTNDFLLASRSAIKALRYERLLTIALLDRRGALKDKDGHGGILSNDPTRGIDSRFFQELHAGDVILIRGSTAVSAGIARIGRDEGNLKKRKSEDSSTVQHSYDTQFSHSFLVHVDAHGVRYGVESNETLGRARVLPIEEILNAEYMKEVAMLLVLRNQNAVLAERASEKAYREISSAQMYFYNYQPQIPIRLLNRSMNCVGLVCHYFTEAAHELKLPQRIIPDRKVWSIADGDDPYVVRAFGLRPGKRILTPGDIEFDSHFVPVAEWIHPERGWQSILFNGAFDWKDNQIQQKGYRFRPSLIGFFTNLIWLFRVAPYSDLWLEYLPRYGKNFKTLMPRNIPRRLVRVIYDIQMIGRILVEKLKEKNEAYWEEEGIPVLWPEISEILDREMAHDSDFKKRVHRLFRP